MLYGSTTAIAVTSTWAFTRPSWHHHRTALSIQTRRPTSSQTTSQRHMKTRSTGHWHFSSAQGPGSNPSQFSNVHENVPSSPSNHLECTAGQQQSHLPRRTLIDLRRTIWPLSRLVSTRSQFEPSRDLDHNSLLSATQDSTTKNPSQLHTAAVHTYNDRLPLHRTLISGSCPVHAGRLLFVA